MLGICGVCAALLITAILSQLLGNRIAQWIGSALLIVFHLGLLVAIIRLWAAKARTK